MPNLELFDGAAARRGYQLNKMCFSLNQEANRQAFLADEDAFCGRYDLTPEQRAAVRSRNVLQMLEAGGNVYYLAKLAGKYAENQKIAVRNVRRDANDDLKKAEKDGNISEDDHRKRSDQVQKLTDEMISTIDHLLSDKEAEIMQV